MSIAMSEIEKFNKDELEGDVNEPTKQVSKIKKRKKKEKNES
jgi:hypothetical protein